MQNATIYFPTKFRFSTTINKLIHMLLMLFRPATRDQRPTPAQAITTTTRISIGKVTSSVCSQLWPST